MKCPLCGSENILDGKLVSYGAIAFVEKGTENTLRPNAYKTECKGCLDCGHIFGLHLIPKKKQQKPQSPK